MLLEICIDDVAGLDTAIRGGADRVELCAALSLGGLSPSPALIGAAAAAPIAAHMLIRPREGGFQYSAREAAMIAADIDAAAQSGIAGIAIGACDGDRRLDTALLVRLIAHARAARMPGQPRLALTLHRAFDLGSDLLAGLDAAIALGFDHVLTSGGAAKAPDATAILKRLHARAAGRITILAGSGIDAASVTPILMTGIRDIHASCGAVVPVEAYGSRRGGSGGGESDGGESSGDAGGSGNGPADEAPERRLGFADAGRRRTDAGRVAALRMKMQQFHVAALE